MLSVKLGTAHLVTKGKKAVFFLTRAFTKLREMRFESFFKVFDAKVLPVLLYSSEVWGMNKIDNVERVHLMACKRYLGVPGRTPNKMVYGELGRYPLFINSNIRCLRYWFRILQMNFERLPRQAYQMLLNMDEDGKVCWATGIRTILSEAGFYSVWLSQGVGDIDMFLDVFKSRLIDMYRQDWFGSMRGKERYELYCTFKNEFRREIYLTNIDIYCFRVALAQLRLGVLPINKNLKRYSDCPLSRQCIFCQNVVEDEHHFLIVCPAYSDIRTRFIDKTMSVTNILKDEGTEECRAVAKFICYAIRRRKLHVESL